jgi:hypothetical protein
MDVGILLAMVGMLIGLYFGVRSIFQSIDMETLQRALRVSNQAMFNHLYRIGGRSNNLLQRDNLTVETREFVTGINETSIAARAWLVAFSREHAVRSGIRNCMGTPRLGPGKAEAILEARVFPL